MREIICRAWLKNSHKMVDVVTMNFYKEDIVDWNGSTHKREDYELMQFTGLIDKNITMIYEGDILYVNYMKIVVKYGEFIDYKSGNTFIGFYLERNDKTAISIGELIKPGKKCSTICEVIGNIYANPELLQGEMRDDRI